MGGDQMATISRSPCEDFLCKKSFDSAPPGHQSLILNDLFLEVSCRIKYESSTCDLTIMMFLSLTILLIRVSPSL